MNAFADEDSRRGAWHDCRVPREILLGLFIRQLQIIVGQNVYHDQLEQPRSVETGRADKVTSIVSMCSQGEQDMSSELTRLVLHSPSTGTTNSDA